MQREVRDCLRAILPEALQYAERLPQDEVPFLVWTRTKSGWHGTHESRSFPALGGRLCPEELVRRFGQTMAKHHPEHLGLVGTAHSLLRLDPEYLLNSLLHEIWERHATFSIGDDAMDPLIAEFEGFIDATHIRIQYTAPLVNLTVEPDVAEIALLPGVTIRQLTDAQVTEMHGGREDLGIALAGRGPHAITEYAFAGEYDEPKRFEGDNVGPSQEYEQVQARLRQAVLALRSFKSGPVGYRELHMKSVGFCPLGRSTMGQQSESIPMGRYGLGADELGPLRSHVRYVAARLHPSLDLAISRLSDAEARFSPRDRLIDAVIGLEALLLPQGQRQELRYRFALDYASLARSLGERLSRFETAKSIYDCRSRLAHGGHIEDGEFVSVGEQELTLAQAAGAACEMLREVVKHFLPEGSRPAFCGQQYWERRLFGLHHPRQH